jgi:hypothetical protein
VDDLEEDKVELALAGGQDEVEYSERSEAHLRRYAGSGDFLGCGLR